MDVAIMREMVVAAQRRGYFTPEDINRAREVGSTETDERILCQWVWFLGNVVASLFKNALYRLEEIERSKKGA